MIQGFTVTLSLFFITLLLALPLGLILAFMRLSKNKLIRNISKAYILLFRGTPLLLQLIFIFFGLPIIGVVFNRFNAAILAFTLNYGAYFAEIYSGSILGIDKGQYEAALVLGMNKKIMYKRIILPQVIKKIISPMSNEVITLIKDTSIVYTIGLNDILRIAQITQNQQVSLMPLVEVGLIYLVLVGTITKIFKIIETKYSYYA